MIYFGVFVGILIFTQVSSFDGNQKLYSRAKRGVYQTFGNSRRAAMNQLADNQNIALLSAQSGVWSSIGQVYGHEQAALAHTVNEYLIPMKKYQQNQLFHAYPSTPTTSETSKNDETQNILQNSDSVPSVSGKHVEKFTVAESKPASSASRTPTEGSGNIGNGHRRDTTANVPTESPTKSKPQDLAQQATTSSEKIKGENISKHKLTEVISVGEDDDDDDKAE